MANDFGLKVGVDGEASFKKSLADINTSLKTLGTEAKLVASQYNENDKSTEALAAKTEVLTKQIETQKRKIETLKNALEASNAKYGEGSKQSQKYQQQLNLAEAELNNLEKAEKSAGTQIEDTADKTEKGGSKIGKAAKTISSGIATITAAAKAAATALAKFATDAASSADDILTESQVTGVATDKLQELAYAADLVDTSVDTITGAMTKNIKSMTAAQNGTADTIEAYEALGVAYEDANGEMRDGEEVFWELIDALGNVENETERDSLAMTLLGKSAQDLNPLIEAGSERMAELAEEAHETGYVMDSETLSSFGALQDQIDTLSNRAQSLALSFGEILLPVLTEAGDTANDALGKIASALKDGDIDGVIAVIDELVPVLLEKISDIVGKVAKALLTNLPKILQTVLDIIYQIVGYITDNIGEIVNLVVVVVQQIVTLLLDNLPTLITCIIDLIVALCVAILDNLPTIIDTISQITPAVVDALIGAIPQLLAGLWEIVKALVKNFPSIMASLFKSLWGELQAGWKALTLNVGPTISEFAQNLVKGLWEGIKSLSSWLWDKVSGWAGDLWDGIKDFFGIHSPSKKFAELGKYMSQGLGNGFVDEMGKVDEEMKNAIPTDFDTDISANMNANISASAMGTTAGVNYGEAMTEQNALLRAILEKDTGVYIGDAELATSVNRYNSNAGLVYVGGGY